MSPHMPEECSTKLIGWSPFVIMGNTMPPRDPEEEDEDEDEEDRNDEPPVVREPDEEQSMMLLDLRSAKKHARPRSKSSRLRRRWI